jgi:hypothetical protein
MSAAALGLVFALLTTIGWALLAVNDPKRGREHAKPTASRLRVVGLVAGLVPGLWLAFAGEGVAFLIWIGAAAVLGWTVSACANWKWAARQSESS